MKKDNELHKVESAKKASKKSRLKGLAVALSIVVAMGIGASIYSNQSNNGNDIPVDNNTQHEISIDDNEHDMEDDHDFVVEEDIIEEDKNIEEEIGIEEEIIEEVVEEDVEQDQEVFDFGSVIIRNYDGVSIVEALHLNGYDSSFEFRAQLAKYHGIEDYVGSSEQNLRLLDILRQRGLTEDEKVDENKPAIEEEIKDEKPVDPENPELPDEPDKPENPDKPIDPVDPIEPGKPVPPVHKHRWSIWEKFTSLFEKRECETCDEVQTRNHTFGSWFKINSTTEQRDCNTCDYEEQRTIQDNHEHKWSKWKDFSDTQEIRECRCGEKAYRGHSWGAWIQNGTVETRTCSTCGRTQTKNIAHEHSWSNWTALDDELEIRKCDCKAEETRGHSFSTSQSLVSNNDGTHQVVTIKNCSTCSKVVTVSIKKSCEYGEWKYNETTLRDERSCDCGHIETREHIHSSKPSNLEYVYDHSNNDGTHVMVASYTCGDCGEVITLTKNDSCEYGEWVDEGTYHKQTCQICGYSKTAQHYPDASGKTISQSNIENQHIESYVCGDCGKTVSTPVSCKSDGTTHYIDNGGTIYEVSYCKECGDITDMRAHTHGYGNWSYLDENTEYRRCSCGHEATQTHSYGDWQPSGDKLIQICSTCGDTREQSHTHNLSESAEKNDVGSADVCYTTVISCDGCSYEEVRSHSHAALDEYVFGDTLYKECGDCSYYEEIEISNSQQQEEQQEQIIIPEDEIVLDEELEGDKQNNGELPKTLTLTP